MTKILGVDSGKHRDATAIVAIKISDGLVLIKNAKRWTGVNYLEVEAEISKIHEKGRYDHVIVETNNTGTHVAEVLKYKYHLPVIEVTTSKDIKDPKKKVSGKTMDKNEMTKVMLRWFSEDKLIFPQNSNPELDELKRQLSIFAEHKTESGNISYYAEGSEHDDLVMALMLACFKARGYLTERKSTIVTTSKRHDIYGGGTVGEIGSGVPSHLRGITQTDYSVRMP